MTRMIGLLTGMAMMAGIGVVQAAPPPQVAQCAGCHGQDGMGNPGAGFPALAGLPTRYLEQQLYAFKHGARRNSLMKGFASGLSAADRKVISEYYHSLPVVNPSSLPAAPKDDLGEKMAMYGIGTGTSHAIPACDSCHGDGGRGQEPLFPRLAGQSAQYLENQLAAWQKGSRNEGNVHIMQSIAEKLSPKQIKAVSAYFASLPPAAPGK